MDPNNILHGSKRIINSMKENLSLGAQMKTRDSITLEELAPLLSQEPSMLKFPLFLSVRRNVY